jgi:signal transduction histidine kinase
MDRLDLVANSKAEEDLQLAGILSKLIWAAWGVFLFVIVIALYNHDRWLIVVTLTGCALLILPLVMLRRRHLHASILILMLIMLGTVTFIATIGQGIRDLTIVSFPILFIFAGLALERKFFRLCVGFALVAVCWLVFGETFGWFTTAPFPIGGMANWLYLIEVILVLLIAALAVDLLATNIHRNLELARTEVAQRKRVEEEIRKLNAELEQRVEERTRELRATQEQLVRQEKLAVLGQLAGGVGHELRNPLAVIKSAIYYLKLVQPDANMEVKEYLDRIEKEIRTSEKIITDLLDFARNSSGERESVSVPELVRLTLERFPVPQPISTVLELPADLPKVYVDPRQMEQVLGNLIVNACQAMGEGGKLTISAKRQKELVAIAVIDTGAGITPENMQKLFEPLFTTKPKGIGLGLAVSRKLAEANEGRIEVQSELGKGSTFTLYVPVHRDEP